MSAPRVNYSEVDLTARVPGFPGVYGAITLPTLRGSVTEPVFVTSQAEFLEKCTPAGTVDVGMDLGHFSALAFLTKSNKLWVRRAVASDATYGLLTFAVDGTPVQPTAATDPTAFSFDSEAFLLYGADPGAWNGNVSVSLFVPHDVLTFEDTAVNPTTNKITSAYHGYETGEAVAITVASPGTMMGGVTAGKVYYISSNSDVSNIMLADTLAKAIAGTDDVDISSAGDGTFSLRPVRTISEPDEAEAFQLDVYYQGIRKETWTVSLLTDQRDGYGNNLFIETVLEGSKYIRALTNPGASGPMSGSSVAATALSTAADGTAVTASQIVLAWGIFEQKSSYPVTAMMDGGWTTKAVHDEMTRIAEQRGDCEAFLSASADATVGADIVEFRQSVSNQNTSWGAMYGPGVKISDRFNNRKVVVPPDGYAAAALSATAMNYEMWYPVAGSKRGVLAVDDVAFRLTEGEADYLYDNGVNPITFSPGRGVRIWGQKTLQRRPSSLDRLNVRCLAIAIVPPLREFLEDNFTFELNDADSRSLVSALINTRMDSVKARRGVTDFRVACDDSNNTPDDEDAGRMNIWLFVKPTRSLEEINLSLIYTSSGLDFTQALQQV